MILEFKKDYFLYLLKKVEDLKPNKREIDLGGGFILIFRYGVVTVGTAVQEEVEFPVIGPGTDDSKVKSLVFDAIGFNDKYITQVEIIKEDDKYELFITPNREEGKVKAFMENL